MHLVKKKRAGNCLFFRDVAIQVSSAQTSLTSVFGMGTGGSSSLSAPAVLWGLCHWTTTCWHRPHSRVQRLAYSRTHTHPPAPLAFCRLAWCLQSPHSLFSFVKVLCRFSFHALSGSYVPFLRTAAFTRPFALRRSSCGSHRLTHTTRLAVPSKLNTNILPRSLANAEPLGEL